MRRYLNTLSRGIVFYRERFVQVAVKKEILRKTFAGNTKIEVYVRDDVNTAKPPLIKIIIEITSKIILYCLPCITTTLRKGKLLVVAYFVDHNIDEANPKKVAIE